MTTRGAIKLFFLFSTLCLVFSSPAWSQITTTGMLNGTVTDPTGAVVPGAAITVTSEATQQETHTVSNGDGSFVVSALRPGSYKITIAKDGFQTYTETGINLNAAQTVTAKAVLSVGQMSATVTVQASTVQVETTTPEVSNVVNQGSVGTLPLNGRNYQSLSFLMPGVTNLAPDTALHQGGFLTNDTISVNGGGLQGTMYYIDGIWSTNGNLVQNTITPNPDTIQEVRLLQNNYGAEYSLNGASVMLLETKSGTQTFHGSAFEYLRNDAFDARNYFSPTVNALKQNIFGYTLGGPFFIPGHYNSGKKDKTYFFWSQQWSIQHVGGTLRVADATEAQREGTFTTPIKDPLTGLPFPQTSPGVYQIPANRINTNSVVLLNALAPLPNIPGGGFLNYINNTPTINNQRDDEAKVDQMFGSKLKLMAEYIDEHQTNANSYQAQAPVPYPTTTESNITRNQIAQVRLTQLITPSMVNTTSLAMNNYVLNLEVGGIQYQSQVPGYNQMLPFPITPRGGGAADRLPFIEFGGGYPLFGLLYILPVVHASELETNLSDDWSYLHGNHYLRAGIQYIRGYGKITAFAPTAGIWIFTGQFTGNALADYLLGDSAELIQTDNAFRGHQWHPLVSPYVEDQWKATRRLTITAGLRYTWAPTPGWVDPNAKAGLYSNFVPSLYNPAQAPIVNHNGTITTTPNYNPENGLVFLGTPGTPLNYTNKYQNYLNPTIGFAYDLFGDGKTSIRGGYAITHVNNASDCGPNCIGGPPSITTATLISPSFPNATGGHPAPATALTLTGQSLNQSDPVSQNYSLSVQRQFGAWFASITGAGDISNHLGIEPNVNQPFPEGGFDFNPIINTPGMSPYASGIAGQAPYQGYGALSLYGSQGRANWNALEINVKHPVGHGVFFSVAYTWQHGLSQVRSTNGFSGPTVQNFYNPTADYGTAPTNVGQILAISTIWNIPLFHNSEGLKKTMLGGWSYSDITSIQGGFSLDPGLTAFEAGQTVGLATRADRVPGTSTAGPKTVAEWFNKAAFTGPPVGFFGNATPGTITGPGTVNFDMALYKDFQVTEQSKFQFRAEFFNIFNHTNFAGVATTFGAGNYGQVTSARDPRIMEFALRYDF